MWGLMILVIIAVYLGAAIWVVVRLKGWKRKTAATVVAVLLPTADGFIGRRYVEHLCGQDGGLKVFRVVQGVEGVLGLVPDRTTLERTGFRFIEIDRAASEQDRKYRRIERLPNGGVLERFDSKALAKYEVVDRYDRSYLYAVRDLMVRERSTEEILARYRQYGGGAGWAERFLGQFTDSGGSGGVSCSPLEERLYGDQLVEIVLKPAMQRR